MERNKTQDPCPTLKNPLNIERIFALTSDLARDLASDLASDLANEIANELALSLDRTLTRDRALSRARDLNFANDRPYVFPLTVRKFLRHFLRGVIYEVNTKDATTLTWNHVIQSSKSSIRSLSKNPRQVEFATAWVNFWTSLAAVCINIKEATAGEISKQTEKTQFENWLLFVSNLLFLGIALEGLRTEAETQRRNRVRRLKEMFTLSDIIGSANSEPDRDTESHTIQCWKSAAHYFRLIVARRRGEVDEGEPFYVVRQRIDLARD